MMKKPKLSIGATGAQGPAGVQGATGAQGLQGAAGTPGPKFLNGAGDPVTALSNNTVIGDYYLDNTAGNLWQRETYTGTINATTLVLAGNVQWKRASVLKGPVGDIAMTLPFGVLSEVGGQEKTEYFLTLNDAVAALAGKPKKIIKLMSHAKISNTVALPTDLIIDCNGFVLYSFLDAPVFQTSVNASSFLIRNCAGIFHYYNNTGSNQPFLLVSHTDTSFEVKGTGVNTCLWETSSEFVKVAAGGVTITVNAMNLTLGSLTASRLTAFDKSIVLPATIAKHPDAVGFRFTAGTTQSKSIFISAFGVVALWDVGSLFNNESTLIQSLTLQNGFRLQFQNNKYAGIKGLFSVTLRNIGVVQTNRQKGIELTGTGSKLTIHGNTLLHSDNTIPAIAVGNVVVTDAFFELQNDTVVVMFGHLIVNFSTTAGTPKFINVPAGPISVDLRGSILGNIINTAAKATMVNGVFNSWVTNYNASI